MNFSDFAVALWLFPVAFQILLPLVIFCGWMVIKIPFLLFGSKSATRSIEPILAR